ncbi:MAG: OmpH family outer membrane protein [Candidatus Omnitrophota bacterium]
MKRKCLAILVGVLVLFFAITSVHAEEKMAYVDLARVFDEYEKTKDYDKLLAEKQKDYEAKRESKLGEVKGIQEQLGLLSEGERVSRESELEDKIAKLQEFDRNATQDLRKERDEKVQGIFKDIKDAIDAYSKKEGFSLVFDKRALVFYTLKIDITDEVLKVLNKKR